MLLLQAAAEQAPKLTKEEIAAMRRANDPNFKKAGENGCFLKSCLGRGCWQFAVPGHDTR